MFKRYEIKWSNPLHDLDVGVKRFRKKQDAIDFADTIKDDYQMITLVDRLTGSSTTLHDWS